MKKLLIITRDFPPYGGRGGVMRILKFVKYLPEFGWQPYVIAEKKDEIEDRSLLQQLPSNSYIEYVYCKTPQKRKNKYKKLLRENSNLSLFQKLNFLAYRSLGYNVFALYQNYLMAPDLSLFWAVEALEYALRLHAKHKYDAFLTSGPPFSTFKVGLKFKDNSKIPWILDFRDGWAGNPIYGETSKFFIALQNKRLEADVIKNSDLVVFATNPLQEIYSKRYLNDNQKMVTVLNGFDAEDIRKVKSVTRNDHKFHLVYSGSIGGRRSPIRFLDTIIKAIQEENELKNHLKISFIGKFREDKGYWDNKLATIFQYRGFLPHHEALVEMSAADVLLFFSNPTEGGKTVMTGKIFEYLALQKPIFAISHRCAATELITQYNAGYVADWENEKEILQQLLKVYDDWKNNRLKRVNDIDPLFHFERKNLTKELAQNLDRIISEKER